MSKTARPMTASDKTTAVAWAITAIALGTGHRITALVAWSVGMLALGYGVAQYRAAEAAEADRAAMRTAAQRAARGGPARTTDRHPPGPDRSPRRRPAVTWPADPEETRP